MATDKELYELHTQGYSPKDIARIVGLQADSVRGRISRYGANLQARFDQLQAEHVALLEQVERGALGQADDAFDLGKPERLSGDFIIIGDVHCGTTNKGFMQRPLEIALQHLESPRRCILAGDFLNANAFSKYPSIYPEQSFPKELGALRAFLELYMQTFDELFILLGNHDRRVQKGTNLAIEPTDLLRMVSSDPRIHISWWGHAVVDTPRGEWRCTHGSEYSVNQLVVADQLAQKYKQHIILHHEHHSAIGLDRYKDFIIVNNGGLFDETAMPYVMLDDSKKPRMANAFTMLKNGYPYLFSPKFTDWSYWLKERT